MADLIASAQALDPATFSALVTVFSLLLIAAWGAVLHVLVNPLFERHDQQFLDYQRRMRARRAVLADKDEFHKWQYGAQK